MKYKLITDVANEPLSLDDIKDVLNIDDECSEFDDLLFAYISAARHLVESQTNFKLGVAVIDCVYEKFRPELWMEIGNIAKVDYVKYYDEDNVLTTLAASEYETDLISFPARIRSAYGKSFPSTYTRYDAVTIRVTTSEDYPLPLLTAMKMVIGHWYENRQDVVTGHVSNVIPQTSRYIMDIYRLPIMR